MKQIQGKQGLVRDIGRFGKPRVQEIGIPLYVINLFCVSDDFGSKLFLRGTASNFTRTSQSKRVNMKSLSRRYILVHNLK